MASLTTFTDWYQSLTPAGRTDANRIRYAGARRAYTWSILTRGKSIKAMAKGGQSLRGFPMLGAPASAQNYGPNDPLTAPMPQVMATTSAEWRFQAWAMSWTKNEEKLNGTSGVGMTDDYRFMRYWDFMQKKETEWEYTAAEGIESNIMGQPNKLQQEALSGKMPYGIFSHLNDHPSGLFQDYATGGGNGTGTWTTKETIDPTVGIYKLFRPQLFGYNSALVNPVAGTRNIVGAIDRAFTRMNYKRPYVPGARAPSSFEDDGWGRKIALTSDSGVEILLQFARDRNDNWGAGNANLGMGDLMYRGVEIFSTPAMGEGAFYLDSYTTPTANATEGASATNSGPRIILIDTDAMQLVFHEEVNFDRTNVRNPDGQPFTNIVWGDVYYQLVCDYPWLCAVIAPGVVTGTYRGGNQLLTAGGATGAVYTYSD